MVTTAEVTKEEEFIEKYEKNSNNDENDQQSSWIDSACLD
jgi:hypothetical protein